MTLIPPEHEARLREAAEHMAQHLGMSLPAATAALYRLLASEAQPPRQMATPLSRWTAWRVRWWMRLGRRRRAQAIILRHCE